MARIVFSIIVAGWVAFAAAAAAADPPPGACVRAVAPHGPMLCASPGLGGDWRAIAAAGVPDGALAEAVAPCARRRTPAAIYTCARVELWRAARRAAPNTLTGRYVARERGLYGELTLLEGARGAVRLSVRTEEALRGHTCRLEASNAWRSGREVAWKGEVAPGAADSACDVSVRPIEGGVVLDSAERCAWACGAAADYRTAYRLER